jgi:hypothetical protein
VRITQPFRARPDAADLLSGEDQRMSPQEPIIDLADRHTHDLEHPFAYAQVAA